MERKRIRPFQNTNHVLDWTFKLIIDEKDIRDHIEYYKLNSGTILTIFSRDGLSEQTCEIIKQHGYILFEPLYAIDQQSYLKII